MSLTSIRTRDVIVGAAASALLVAGSAAHALPFSRIEVAGFVTGGIAVWLLVREDVWNWPVGIANSGIYFVVFMQARLFADGALQLAFIVLGLPAGGGGSGVARQTGGDPLFASCRSRRSPWRPRPRSARLV